MKLKEKLAKEYAIKLFKCDIPLVIKPEMEAFVAGFEKAREMSVDLWFKGTHTSLKDFMTIGEEEIQQ